MEFVSKYYDKTDPVSIYPLKTYDPAECKAALLALLAPIGSLDFIEAGMTVVIKTNLVSAMKPEQGGTTHPALLCALCDLLGERGARVIVGDSPGGLYNATYVNRVYRVSGVREVESHGASLNDDFTEGSAVFEKAKVLRTFTYTKYLDKADVIINFCKLKSHGMMGMSAAAKNMFGTVPGIIKPEYHYRFPKYEDFADMILDLNEYFHPVLSITDAVIGMEGNGPTAGTPREMGFVMASHNPHNLDHVASRILGFTPSELPILHAAILRDMTPGDISDIPVFGSPDEYILPDFARVVKRHPMEFLGDSKGIGRLFGKIASSLLKTRPVLKKDACVGCGVCRDICPAKAIKIEDGKAKIDRKKCIRCFCCQEFCPKSAMKVKRTFIADMFHSEK